MLPKENPTTMLYISGPGMEPKPLTDIPEIEFTATDAEPYMHFPFSNEPITFRSEPGIIVNGIVKRHGIDMVRLMAFFLTGRFPSNNWMKMHGFPMERRRRK